MKGQLAVAILFAIGGTGRARAQSAIERLQPLVETSARRLAIAEQVAFAKWDSHAAVEDAPREKQVIMAAVKYGESKGLDGTLVSKVFAAQIEANKLVQYSLLADWHRAGRAPDHKPISLAAIRRDLDQLQIELIGELADTAAIRGSATCDADTARAVGKYLIAHQHDDRSVQAIALDRALAAVCSSE
ncbi:MAG: chorismate mutase [Bryobacterales bacterium]|nr:chorismate mutase [Bryobacterales bacterium]